MLSQSSAPAVASWRVGSVVPAKRKGAVLPLLTPLIQTPAPVLEPTEQPARPRLCVPLLGQYQRGACELKPLELVCGFPFQYLHTDSRWPETVFVPGHFPSAQWAGVDEGRGIAKEPCVWDCSGKMDLSQTRSNFVCIKHVFKVYTVTCMCLAGLSFVVIVTNCLTSVCHIGLVVINVHFYTIAAFLCN